MQMNANIIASSVTFENSVNIPRMALHVMGATLTKQAVRGNVTACNRDALLLCSARKYDCICQVQLRETPWTQRRHNLPLNLPHYSWNFTTSG